MKKGLEMRLIYIINQGRQTVKSGIQPNDPRKGALNEDVPS